MTSREFTEKIVALRHKVFRFAARLTSDDEQARDVVQDVMETMWRRRGSLGQQCNIEAFVMQSAKNRCLDILRRRKVAQAGQAMIRDESPVASRGIAPIERSETRALIHEAIVRLPEKQRMAIHLRDVEGYEFDEIAHIMQCDLPSVRVYLSRARKTVREQLQNYVKQ